MIADLSSSEVFLKFKKCKYCWVLATFILGDVAFLTLHGPYTLGKEFDEYLRNFVIDADGNHGVSIVYWKSNLSFLILCTTMMLYVELIPSVQAIFAFRPFVYLGRISFCLYLFHSTFIETIGRYVVGRIGFKTGYQIQWSILASTIIMIIISDILTRIIDDPSVWLANWTERGLIHGDWTIKSQIIQAILSMIYRLWKGLFRFVKGIRARRKQSKFQYNPIPSP
jgi:hypothetical protein